MISVSFNLVSVSILNVGTVSILLELYAASLLDLILNAAVEGVKNKGRIEYFLESVVNECVGCSLADVCITVELGKILSYKIINKLLNH